MKGLLPSRVTPRKETERMLPVNAGKHESRIEHYLDLANIALIAKKKQGATSTGERRARVSRARRDTRSLIHVAKRVS
jgi:hypothetical protein